LKNVLIRLNIYNLEDSQMKLQDLAAAKPTQHISKVFESYFGSKFDVSQLTAGQTNSMLRRVRQVIGEHRSSTGRHQSERNPGYLKLVMVEQALAARLSEMMPAAASTPEQQKAQQAMATASIGATKDPKLKAALTKATKGQSLTPDEQKMVAGAALMKTESKLARAYKMLKESEVQQAQVVLAAQDMVDKMQGMLEDISELQFKELPALVDSIKNQVGIDQAQQFNTDVSAALSGLMQNLQQAKQQMDAALGVVTGQSTGAGANLGAELGAQTGAEAGAELGAELGADTGADLDAAAPDAGAELDDEPAGGQVLGRARR
jgi:hypothetical protein